MDGVQSKSAGVESDEARFALAALEGESRVFGFQSADVGILSNM